MKKDLLELGNGQMPPGVRLLCFDTTSQPTAEAGKRGGRGKEEEEVRAGAVGLTPNIEFFPIGDNVMQLASEIADGQHPHMQWFPARAYLGKLPPAAFVTKEGSGQIRQMGRISLFRDVSATAKSEILSRLRDAIQNMQGDVSRDRQLEIIIVSSLAGGTGAGMLIDMALLVRAQAQALVQKNYVLRGFFLLPRAFTAGGLGEDRDMLARSFAAWRELDRFMIVSERFGAHQVNYSQQNSDLRLRVAQRAYDVSYLIDPARPGVNSLENVKAEEGVYPAVAHCVSAILDDIAGKAYTEFVTTNLSGKLAQLPRRPYHSAIGSYTLKVPVYYAHEKFTHQLALEVLGKLLAPERNDRGVVNRISSINNREVPQGHAGWPAVRSFMSASALNLNGQEIPNTALMPLMAQVRDGQGQDNGNMIAQWANGGLSRAGHPVVRALADVSQDDAGKKVMADINAELNLLLWNVLPPSRQAGDTPTQGYSRIVPRVAEVRHEHYGLDDVSGSRMRGKYGLALDSAQTVQMARFRRLLMVWTLNALNGQSPDPDVARGGKLGYVQAFYRELEQTFNYFVGFLNKVRQQRNEVNKIGARAKNAAGQAMQAYQHEKDKRCWFTFWDGFTHPDAYSVQRHYLEAEQRSIDVRKDDILMDELAETALAMKEYAARTLEEVESWVAHLATGAAGVNSLYGAASASLNNVLVNHQADKHLGRVSELIGEHEYQARQEYINGALSSIVWAAEPRDDRLVVTCGVMNPTDNLDQPARYVPFKRDGVRPEQQNLSVILRMAEQPFHNLQRERPLAREIALVYPTGDALATAIHEKGEPLYLNGAVPIGPQTTACYIRVHADVDDTTRQYFDEFNTSMRALKPMRGSTLATVDSEDKHKMTLVRSDDLVPSTDFAMWYACRQAYINQVTDTTRGVPAAELHVFPAEINACYYEAAMPRLLRREYKTLHPEVVALLEDRERFEMFFRAKALGFIGRDLQRGQPFWSYRLPDAKEGMHVTVPSERLEGQERDDFFQIIHNFVLVGYDQRAGHGSGIRVDWGKLRDAILTAQREMTPAAAAKKYHDEISKGIVKQMRDEAKLLQDREPDENRRQLVAQELFDLADLSEVVLLRAAESLRS
ncbi:MAG: hypothetical protein KBG73_12375 [Candidatus Promineofilum sp.]|nr:hypothetical protein [Promineifilum sp.]